MNLGKIRTPSRIELCLVKWLAGVRILVYAVIGWDGCYVCTYGTEILSESNEEVQR